MKNKDKLYNILLTLFRRNKINDIKNIIDIILKDNTISTLYMPSSIIIFKNNMQIGKLIFTNYNIGYQRIQYDTDQTFNYFITIYCIKITNVLIERLIFEYII